MVDINTVLYHIAEDLRQYSGGDKEAAIEEFLQGCTFNIHLAITTDVEESELDFLERYGYGRTFYFRLVDYKHGKQLSEDLYWVLLGEMPDMSDKTGACFEPDDKLYLFIHISEVSPQPLKAIGKRLPVISI